MRYPWTPSLLPFHPSRFAHIVALITGLISFSASLAVAGQRSDGQFFFDHAPRLVEAGTSAIATTYTGGTTYDFIITVPQDAGAALQAIRITQEVNAKAVEFNLNQSRAIAANGSNIPLTGIGGAQEKDTTIAFERPIQPGERVTVSLTADRNPKSEGLYLFGVTAYPVNNSNNGLFLGYGRVRIYSYGG